MKYPAEFAMPSSFLDSPGLFQTILEELPVGIYVVDKGQKIRFWNRGAEHIIGHLAHEVVGRLCTDHIAGACDRQGQSLCGDRCPVAATLKDGQTRRVTAYCLHKQGHRLPVEIRSQAIVRNGDFIEGALVVFEELAAFREESTEGSMYGCLDIVTGIPAQRLTRAVLNESVAGMEESHRGFGILRFRVLGIDEFRSKHGPQSVVPFLSTAAHTLRRSLDPTSFLGRWGEDEFMAVLPSASPVATAAAAETAWNLVTQSEVCWWGDRFPIEAVVTYTVAQPGDKLEKLLNGLEPQHAGVAGRALGPAGNGASVAAPRG